MVLKRLPLDVQSIFCASTQIKTFKTAVEELVYNALDANSTSIAIRVNIQKNHIQVVDNGHGVSKDDFRLLGQRYATSRYGDSITFRSFQKYGHSGQSLANIIQISQSVKITSRCKNSEETWLKHFYNGKEEECILTSSRPSVGTTVEIEGFLYNLTIQKKAVKALQELQKIRTFLEQMSLVHCSTSISLRDNSENEIIFKIHKNRDTYQTLSSLLGIDKSNLQELQVEKNQYKVRGLIQKQDTESCGFQWIFVNRRFIDNSNLHTIINHNLAKSLPQKLITKIKNRNNEEDKITTNNKVPDYFIFIECPLHDYEIIANPKQSMLEFKNCSQINKLLEKLMEFYNGGVSLRNKTIAKKYVEEDKSKTNNTNTRTEVKMIMEKILGSHHKKINGSQIHNGVKGKIIKRKKKKNVERNPKSKDPNSIKDSIAPPEIHKCDLKLNDQSLKKVKDSKIKDNDCTFKIPKRKQHRHITSININKMQKQQKDSPQKTKNGLDTKDPIISKFEKETGEVQKRREMLARKVDNLLCFKRKRKRKFFTNEYVQYSTVIRDSKKMTIRKKIDEVIIHEYLPLPPKAIPVNRDSNIVMKSYDLLHPVTTTFQQNHVEFKEFCPNTIKKQTDVFDYSESSLYDINIPRLTYESHCYVKDTQGQHTRQTICEKDNYGKFISHVSQDNFLSPKKRRKVIFDRDPPIPIKKHTITKKANFMKTGNYKQSAELQSSYSIHFTATGSQPHETPNITPVVSDFNMVNDKSIGSTYTIIDSDQPVIDLAAPKMTIHNAVHIHDFQDTYYAEALCDVDCDVDQSLNYNDGLIKSVTPKICETYCVKRIHDFTDEPSKLHDSLKVDGTPEICQTYSIEASLSHDNKYYTNQSPKMQEFQDLNQSFNANFLGTDKFNVIFISNSQQSNTGMIIGKDIDPVHICETVFNHQDAYDNEEYNFMFNSFNDINNEENIVKPTELRDTEIHNKSKNQDDPNIFNGDKEDEHKEMNPGGHATELNNFHLKNRRRYIPKGMSQIFENCYTSSACNYEFDKDYFEDTVYNNFVEDVQINSEIFEPRIQNVKELATRDFERVNSKLNKDNACLTFDGESLKKVKVLGQVDYKFIATKIQDKSKRQLGHLVLFDQHAVDERIKLEKNMADYFDGDQWKSVTLDGISLKLNKDEILYLHNYKKKFHKLGLEWTIQENNEVSITAIPEAILGKNPRQVETVLKAVKSLIKEEITMMREQGGCVSLYPKSIMDLVFSEACRYAIMFGDALSKIDCTSLLNALSECKTPFQCAHGRPVMAVLMDIGTMEHEYKVNFKRVQQFRKRKQNLNK